MATLNDSAFHRTGLRDSEDKFHVSGVNQAVLCNHYQTFFLKSDCRLWGI